MSAKTSQLALKAEESAEVAMAEPSRFVLPEQQWAAFNAALAAPAQEIPALWRLLTAPSVFAAP